MKRLNDFFDETGRFVFASSVVIMLVAHGFCFMNLMYSHDSLCFYEKGGFDKVGLGRWLYPFLVQSRLMATPWVMGALSILYVSLSVVMVTKLFDFCRIRGLCVAALFATNIALTCLFCSFIYDADADCLGLLMACLAVFAFKKFPKIFNIIVPVPALVLCLALYQAYICVAVGLFIALLIRESGKCNSWNDVLSVFLLGVKELITLILSMVLYIPLMRVAARCFGVELSNSYNGAGNLSSLTLHDIIEAIPTTYEYFRDTFLEVSEINTVAVVTVNRLMLIILIISVLIYIVAHRKFLGSLVIVLPCIFVMPLALDAIYLVSFGMIHQLMIFAFCLAYLLPLLLIPTHNDTVFEDHHWNTWFDYARKTVCAVTVLAVLIIGFNNIVYANGAYVYKKLVYDNTALHAQTIWKDINSIDGYREGETPVVFVGEFNSSRAAYNSPIAKRYYGVLNGCANSAVTYPNTDRRFFEGILGRKINLYYDGADISENDEVLNMPIYPANGYCRMIDDKVVVKLSKQ